MGGFVDDVNVSASSSLDVKQSFESRIGGNAGINFGQSKAASLAWPIAIASAALLYFLTLKKKRTRGSG